ncbi:DUF6624 domain-containing protein [Tenacibaculum sp. SG-28]|uniref:DUF6624 domain-containing protein n=1 Tax=Tenacibaculum sp. SG-28 TaxID=754426 RepID=UPI000CF4F951|nr:DUF6624 domain-containing protein [Tenacibaculum sp. SG-28]PQJ20818.1 hypothetical protein BSU00_09965 [Tenacibaculum sp. SG-28]
MNKIIALIIIGSVLFGCKAKIPEKVENQEKVAYNQKLADELKKMVEIDQIAAFIPEGIYKDMTSAEWTSFKDSVFTTHQKRLNQIFDTFGFVGFDLVGQEGSQNFWLMVQHCDHNKDFQIAVLEKMEIAVTKGNAQPSNYGLLLDRVLINTNKKQIYGTQVTYNFKTGQAYPQPLKDSTSVNERRKSIGLEPLEKYLNEMTEMHFEMNKNGYLKELGISKPKLYEIKE